MLQLPRTKHPAMLKLISTACFPPRPRGARQTQHLDHCHPLAHQTPPFSGHGGDGLAVGLDDLRGLFQT